MMASSYNCTTPNLVSCLASAKANTLPTHLVLPTLPYKYLTYCIAKVKTWKKWVVKGSSIIIEMIIMKNNHYNYHYQIKKCQQMWQNYIIFGHQSILYALQIYMTSRFCKNKSWRGKKSTYFYICYTSMPCHKEGEIHRFLIVI